MALSRTMACGTRGAGEDGHAQSLGRAARMRARDVRLDGLRSRSSADSGRTAFAAFADRGATADDATTGAAVVALHRWSTARHAFGGGAARGEAGREAAL